MKRTSVGRKAAFRVRASSTASIFAILAATPFAALAADQPAPQTGQAPATEEIVVTGSRIVRNGYEAPTPVTVVGVEEIADQAKQNVFDAVANLPAFSGNTTPATSNSNISMGIGGSSTLNLRGLGVNRTLVLLDGRRFPDTFVSGGTDSKLFPDLLVSRVDVVTGGASAVYGSDAVSGVVNFVLDKDFVGVKGNLMGGVTTYGDHREYKISMAGGFLFAGGRGHALIAADYGYQQSMDGTQRDWNLSGFLQVPNPAYTTDKTQPQILLKMGAGLWTPNLGGVIASGPLKGIAFGPGGTPYNYNFGSLTTSTITVGGDWRLTSKNGDNSLSAGISEKHLFGHVSYDITDNVTLFAEYNVGSLNTYANCCLTYYLGSNISVKLDNPFIPASVAAQATALKLTSLPLGKNLEDIPPYSSANQRNSFVYVIGGKGNFDALDTSWKWDFYAQRGLIKLDLNSPIQIRPANFALAIDAVRAPNGAIVCRSSLTSPTNGCVPYNLFGTPGVNSQAAINYVTSFPDYPHNSQAYGQSVAAANISGEPFSDWAGPVSLAAGVEWRKQSILGTADPIAQAKGWFSTNYISWPYVSESVVEGNAETVIPLAKDTAWAKALDFNGAVRFTDYSVSGSVVTWKAGLSYSPIDDFRVRLTQSRDIRAPNLNDLFAPGQLGHGAIQDPFQGNGTFEFGSTQQGNTALQPEKADTTGIGGVYQPSWLPGFSTSVDYYNIKLNGAVASPTSAFILQQCYAGVTSYCGFIHRNAAGILQSIDQKPVNSNVLWTRGIDVEASYRTALSSIVDSWNGDISLRAVATHVISLKTLGTTLSISTGSIGGGGLLGRPAPSWSGQLVATYSNDPVRFTWTERYVSDGKMFADVIACASACPNPVPAGLQTMDQNHMPSYYLANVAISYALFKDGARNAELYVNVDNVFNRDPPLVAEAGVTYSPMTEASIYDTYGRSFRLGMRFKF